MDGSSSSKFAFVISIVVTCIFSSFFVRSVGGTWLECFTYIHVHPPCLISTFMDVYRIRPYLGMGGMPTCDMILPAPMGSPCDSRGLCVRILCGICSSPSLSTSHPSSLPSPLSSPSSHLHPPLLLADTVFSLSAPSSRFSSSNSNDYVSSHPELCLQ